MNNKKKGPDRRKCRVYKSFVFFKLTKKNFFKRSTRDMRMLGHILNQNRFEEHEQKVREEDAEFKNMSGELKRSSTKRSSLNASSGSRNSLNSLISENNEKHIQFVKDRSEIMNSVKERLRKMQNPKKNYRQYDLSGGSMTRTSLGRFWSKYEHLRAKQWTVNRFLPNNYSDYPENHTNHLTDGQEHSKRLVQCFICSDYIESTSYLHLMDDGTCLHNACMERLRS